MENLSPIIHLGLQKTASTFLQKSVFGALDVFHMPWGEQSANAIEHFVLRHPKRLDPAQIQQDLTPPDGKVTVISQEDLIGYPIFGRYYAEQTIRRMAQALPSARILLVIREQRSILLSNYFQSVRQGGTLTLEEMLEPKDYRPGFRPLLRLDHFEYDLTYALLSDHFDPDQILVLPFELLRKDKTEFLDRLSRFCAVDIPRETGEKTVYQKRGGGAMRLERFLNRFAPNPVNLPVEYSDYPLRVRARERIVSAFDKTSRRVGLKSRYQEDLQAQIDRHVGDYFDVSNKNMSKILQVDLGALGYRVAP